MDNMTAEHYCCLPTANLSKPSQNKKYNGWLESAHRKLDVEIGAVQQPHVARQQVLAGLLRLRGGHLPLPHPHRPHRATLRTRLAHAPPPH